jgi:hypothetical protein
MIRVRFIVHLHATARDQLTENAEEKARGKSIYLPIG